jgi:hypothetical protein
VKAVVLILFLLQGCAIQGVGCWVANEDPRHSFTLQWHMTPKDSDWEEPNREIEARWRAPHGER